MIGYTLKMQARKNYLNIYPREVIDEFYFLLLREVTVSFLELFEGSGVEFYEPVFIYFFLSMAVLQNEIELKKRSQS